MKLRKLIFETMQKVPGIYLVEIQNICHILVVHGEIRTTACQARLIIAERFHQFSGLISQCENKTGEKSVLEEDLDGFWDMIYFQVRFVCDFIRLIYHSKS